MARSLVPYALVAALLSAGCVPVTNPVGDIDKAEPNKDLLGEWQDGGMVWVVDRPDVKGNPKGLMRARIYEGNERPPDGKTKEVMWFFTAKVGKFTYGNLLIDLEGGLYADFSKEGAYKRWSAKSRYWVGGLTLKDDKLTIENGDEKGFKALMEEGKIEADKHGYFKAPAGWLAKRLEKREADSMFGGGTTELTRVKKK